MRFDYIIADDCKTPLEVGRLEVQRQRCTNPSTRAHYRALIDAARAGDVEALAKKGFRPWEAEEELSASDGFALGLARVGGM